jgi:hypothetical protein
MDSSCKGYKMGCLQNRFVVLVSLAFIPFALYFEINQTKKMNLYIIFFSRERERERVNKE